MDKSEHLRYPIGKFEIPKNVSKENIDHFIEVISEFPERVQSTIEDLEEKTGLDFFYKLPDDVELSFESESK